MSKIYEKSCAPSDTNSRWEKIDFLSAKKSVKKLQRRIVKALINLQFDKVEVLQHKLIHSFYAKALAVKIVTSNRGKYTYGVDEVLWITPEEKFNAISSLSRRGYKPKPLKRVYIPKADGRFRPLSIPTMKDRAMQTLYKFALEPIAEVMGDDHSYGFRRNRSTRDAIIQCGRVLYAYPHFEWILEADIKSCFDNISHEWVMDNIPIDKEILYKFIKNGFIKHNEFHSIEKGIPQGGSISTVICNMVLDGLEGELQANCECDLQFIRYADDFVVISDNKEALETSVINIINSFLSERGLLLSQNKTFVTHIDDGFDFLGWNVKRYKSDIFITPSKRNINSLIDNVTDIMIFYSCSSVEYLYELLKPVITGWINYHKDIVDLYSLYDAEYELCSAIREQTNDNRLSALVGSFFRSL